MLFDDLGFYGVNKLNSRRVMTVWELEARRDRKFFKAVLEKSGPAGLKEEALRTMARQGERPMQGVQSVRGRSTNVEPERDLQLAFLKIYLLQGRFHRQEWFMISKLLGRILVHRI